MLFSLPAHAGMYKPSLEIGSYSGEAPGTFSLPVTACFEQGDPSPSFELFAYEIYLDITPLDGQPADSLELLGTTECIFSSNHRDILTVEVGGGIAASISTMQPGPVTVGPGDVIFTMEFWCDESAHGRYGVSIDTDTSFLVSDGFAGTTVDYVTSDGMVTIPEPCTLLLMCVGAGFMAGRKCN